MRLIPIPFLVSITFALGCGPGSKPSPDSEWMLGWYSFTDPSNTFVYVDDNTNIHVEEDGAATLEGFSSCKESGAVAREWVRRGDDEIFLTVPAGEETSASAGLDGWILRRLPACAGFEWVEVLEGGEEFGPDPIYRGQLCMVPGEEDESCVGSDCTVCHKSWCEGEEPLDCKDES